MKLQLRKICSICLVMCLLICMCAVGIIHPAAASEAEYKYYDRFKDYYDSYYGTTGDEFWTKYIEKYEYYSNGSSSDEATPDFAVVFCCTGYEFSSGPVVFGDYIIHSACNYPYFLGLYIITPNDGKIYTFTEAYSAKIEGIEEMLEKGFNSGSVSRIGDVDQDYKLTVKDATLIQKSVAGLATIKDDELYYNIASCLKDGITPNARYMLYRSDFNYDYERNVKDATAIQKHIAGLAY